MTEQARKASWRFASPDECQAVNVRFRLGVRILRNRELATLVLKLDKRSRHLERTVGCSRHRPGVAHRIEHGARASRAHMERDAGLDPQILLAGKPHPAAKQERNFLPFGKSDSEVLPRQLTTTEIKHAELAQLGGFRFGDERLQALDELRPVEEAYRPSHGRAIEPERCERDRQAKRREPC